MGRIVTAEGDQFYAYPEILGKFQPGTTWRIETSDNEFQGRTYRRIVKAQAIKAAAAPIKQRDDDTFGGPGGMMPFSADPPAPRGAPPTPAASDETYYIVEMLRLLALNGQIKDINDISKSTASLRAIYRGLDER